MCFLRILSYPPPICLVLVFFPSTFSVLFHPSQSPISVPSQTKIDTDQKYTGSIKNLSGFDLLVTVCPCLACLLQSGELGEVIGVTRLRFSSYFLLELFAVNFDLWLMSKLSPLRTNCSLQLRHAHCRAFTRAPPSFVTLLFFSLKIREKSFLQKA